MSVCLCISVFGSVNCKIILRLTCMWLFLLAPINTAFEYLVSIFCGMWIMLIVLCDGMFCACLLPGPSSSAYADSGPVVCDMVWMVRVCLWVVFMRLSSSSSYQHCIWLFGPVICGMFLICDGMLCDCLLLAPIKTAFEYLVPLLYGLSSDFQTRRRWTLWLHF